MDKESYYQQQCALLNKFVIYCSTLAELKCVEDAIFRDEMKREMRTCLMESAKLFFEANKNGVFD